MNLKDRYEDVLAKVADAAQACGRNAADIHLIAVSKMHPVALVDELATFGQVDFAENRIAELVEKQQSAKSAAIQWHLIGQLQTNKVKLLPHGVIVHSLDRLSLAEKLQDRFSAGVKCLLQVNCSGEMNKSGVAPVEFDALVAELTKMPAIQVLGLMTMAEHTTEEGAIRKAFALLRSLSEKIHAQQVFPEYRGWLSMGMSGDFRHAIAEGATHVRIGSAIFGNRQITSAEG